MTTREDFEAWASAAYHSTETITENGYYTDRDTRLLCAAWQAATSRQEAKIKALVTALEELDKEWRELNTTEFSMQGEETNAFYSLPSTITAIAAAKETP